MLLLSSDKDAVPALFGFFAVTLPSSSSDLANVSTEPVWLNEVERHWFERELLCLQECDLSRRKQWLRPGCDSRAHRGCLLLGLNCQLSSQCRCSPYLLGHLVCSLLVLLRFPRVLSPGTSGSVHPLGSSIVVHHFHSRVGADLQYFSTLHCAGVYADDLPCRGFTKAEPFIDKPFVDDHLHDL